MAKEIEGGSLDQNGNITDEQFFIDTGDIGSTLEEDDRIFDEFRSSVSDAGFELIDLVITQDELDQLNEG